MAQTYAQPLRINDGAAPQYPQTVTTTAYAHARFAGVGGAWCAAIGSKDTDTSELGATFGAVQHVLKQFTLVFPWQVSFAWAMPESFFGLTRECKRFTFLPNALQISNKKNLYWMPPEVSTDIIPRYRIVGIHLKTTTSPPLASVWAGWLMMFWGIIFLIPIAILGQLGRQHDRAECGAEDHV